MKNGSTTDAFKHPRFRTGAWKIAIAAALAIASASTLRGQLRETQSAAPTAPAAGPTSRPSWRGGMGGFDGDHGPPGMGRRGPGENWREMPVPTADEWNDVVTFMKDNSPNRLQMYAKLEAEKGVDHPITQGVRKRAAARYRDLIAMRDRNSDLYEFAFKQFKIEDAVLATLAQIRRLGETPELVDQRQKQVHDFVQNSLDERQARLGKLRELVSREEDSLARDRADMNALEEKQRDRFDHEMRRMIDFAVDGDGPSTRPGPL